MLKKSTFTLFALLVLLWSGGVAHAQTPVYGNEWIQSGQPYWKVNVSQRGIHRLSQAWLTAAGLPVTTLDPTKLQLWRRGQQQAIYVAQTAGRVDYVDFWGLPNDARLDGELFKNPADQITHLTPIYTDTAAYFLTISPTQNGLRMPQLTSTTTGLTPRNHYLAEVLDVHRSNYFIGRDYGQIYLPWLDGPEGFFGNYIGTGARPATGSTSIPDVTLSIPALDTTHIQPMLELTVMSCGYDAATFELRLMRGTTASPTVIRTVGPYTLPSFGNRTIQVPLRYADFNTSATGNVIRCRVAVTNAGVGIPLMSVVYGRLRAGGRTALNRLSLLVNTDSTIQGPSQYLLFDTPPPTTVAYDVTDPNNPTRITGQTVGQQWGVVVPTPTARTRRVFISKDGSPLEPPAGQTTRFRSIQPRPNLYLIVTGEQLMNDSLGNHPIRAYANYRASPVGGAYDTMVVTVQQLYDLCHYGDKSPNALRRFLSYLGNTAGWPRYMFVVGKGYQPSHLTGFATMRRTLALDIVPAAGTPGTDILYSADFRAGSYFPRVPCGRLSAVRPADVTAYLNKVQQHEATGVEPWRKEIMHLGGGKTNGEQRLFGSFLNDFARRAEDSVYLGGHVTSVLRGNSGSYVTTIDVSAEVNRGLSLITFFGHSSTSVSDIDIGTPSNPINNYNNTGRYPTLLMNGCASGNAFFPGVSFGEDWVLTPQRGAIAFLAHSGEGAPTYLRKYSSTFYSTAFNDSAYYGKSLGQIQQRVIQRLMPDSLSPQDPLAVAQVTEMVLQADPAVHLYSPDKPDYFVDNSMVSIRPYAGQRVTARTDSFMVVIKVRNLAKATRDQVRVQVKRTLPGGSIATTDDTFRPIYYGDTIFFKVKNLPGQVVQGLNRFDVFVDWPDSVAEMNENNNQATVTLNIPAGSVFPLYPPEFAIVTTNAPSLYGQYDQAFQGTRPYTFELDTVPTFNSSGSARQTAVVTGGRYPLWTPTLPTGRDSLVWYWRFKPQTLQPGEDTTWATSSFRRINGTRGGWSQSHYGQFARDRKQTIRQQAPSGKWSYTPTTLRLELRTVTGAGTGVRDTATFTVPPNGIVFNQSNRTRSNCGAGSPNIMFMVFDPHTFEPLSRIPGLPGGGVRMTCGQEGNPGELVVFHGVGDTIVGGGGFAITNLKGPTSARVQYMTARADTLAKVLNAIPAGYIVAMVSMNRVPFELMRAQKPNLIAAIQSLGSSLIASPTLLNGDPFLLVGVKGSAPGTATERSYDPSLPRARQQVVLTTTKVSNLPQGLVMSTEVGPARQWDELFYTIKQVNTTGRYDLRIIPIDANGRDGAALPVTAPSSVPFPLTRLNAQQYPKLRLELFSQDTINRQAPQLKQWLVTYQVVPEGVVRAELLRPWELDRAAQLDSGFVHLAVPFQNIAPVAFTDSILTEFTVDPPGPLTGPIRVKIPALAANSLGRIPVKIPITRFSSGTYTLRANVNPNAAQPEQYLFNNVFETSFTIENPNMAPLVDVAFDGQHILYGDIVAPAPTITIVVQDDNKLQPIDPQKVTIALTRPGQTTGVAVPVVGNSAVEIHPATASKPLELLYRPGRLDDGLYKLDVNATDADGNSAGDNQHAYKSAFQVINEAMISNFYPYPNPFSTNTRFLFTITGKVPQNLKVQIMTVTGKVVRELTKEDLGTDLRVGNNVGTQTWDGTDEYGDKLANGVYLYRVVVQDDADTFKSYKTAGDQKAFHKGWGKLYILR